MARFRLRSLGPIELPPTPPTVDAAREVLGGRASTDRRAGDRVRIRGGGEGVIVFASDREIDVWIGEGRMQRVEPGACEPSERTSPELETIAGHARRFAGMGEGEPVVYLDRAGAPHDGTLVEKCRWGALVLAESGKVIAVAFRRLV